jgi:prevent-host-death family protein
MREMSLREFRQVMGVIDEVLAAHGELTITRHGRPIAKVVPLPSGPFRAARHFALTRLEQRRRVKRSGLLELAFLSQRLEESGIVAGV